MQNHQNSALVTFSPRLEAILSDKIGYGKAQFRLVLPIAILMICEGAQTIAIGMILPIIKKSWALSTMEQAIGLTLINIGFPLGSIIQTLSDNYGRKPFITVDASLLVLFGLLSVISWNFPMFIVFRFVYEIAIGMCLPLAAAFTSEICEAGQRATLLCRMWILWVGGYMLSCLLGYFFLVHNQWRLVLLVLCSPSILALILQLIVGRQTLHYLWVRNNPLKVHTLVNQMCQDNGNPALSLEYIENQMSEDQQQHQDVSIKELFNDQYRWLTLKLMLVWLCIYFNYYAITLLLPTTLHRAFSHVHSVAGLEYFYLMALSVLELIFNYLSPYIMNHPSIGRKSGIFWTLILIIIFSILSIILGSNNLIGTFVCLSVIKASVTVAFAIVYIYTAELYETLLRSKAEGFCALLGRTSTAFLGIVGLPATKWLNGQGLFLLFAVMSVFGSIAIFRMPFDTLKARKN